MQARLAFFMPSLGGGGVERVVLTLAEAFSQKGIRVDLVLGTCEGPMASHVPPAVAVRDLNCKHALGCIIGLGLYLRETRPTALIATGIHTNAAAALATILMRSPVRLVATVHNTISRIEGGATLKRTFWQRLLKCCYWRVDATIAVSYGVACDYAVAMGLSRSSITVIYNPAVRSDLRVKANQSPAHAWLMHKTFPVVLAVGRLTRQKDYPTLIHAFRRVHSVTGARLIILGEGEERASLESLIRNKGLTDVVSMPGFRDNPYPFMKRADAFVLASRWEGFGLVLAETLALGTPVVSTDCPNGPAEILENGRWGRLVPVGDADALARAVIETLQQSQRNTAILRANDFSVHQIVEQYADALGVTL